MAKSAKRLQIDKANARMILFIAGAAFLIIFSLVSSRALLSQRSYQSRVIAEKEKARNQLQENIKAAESLAASYREFVALPENILGGNPNGRGDKDGDNAKIVLDALPSKYDFPALTASLEKIVNKNKTQQIESIGGSDDEVNQKANQGSAAPEPVEIPFEMTVNGNYPAIQTLLTIMERSIRPLQMQKLEFTGSDNSIQLKVTAKSYYQPEKTLNITTKAVQ